MGILDDAIREHLELKRQHGAATSDLDRLEQEVFGPVARPGDPEFETGEEPAEADRRAAEPLSRSRESPDGSRTRIRRPSRRRPPRRAAEPERPPPSPNRSSSRSRRRPRARSSTSTRSDLGEIDLDDGDDPGRAGAGGAFRPRGHRRPPGARGRVAVRGTRGGRPDARRDDSAELEIFAASPAEEPGPGDPEVPASTDEPESLEFDQLPGETVEPAAVRRRGRRERRGPARGDPRLPQGRARRRGPLVRAEKAPKTSTSTTDGPRTRWICVLVGSRPFRPLRLLRP